MPSHDASWTEVPFGADQTLYAVVDRLSGTREVRIERSDLEATIGDLVAGCFNDPVRVVAFNTLEHWLKDVSAEVAAEIQSRCDIEGVELPDHLRDFVEASIRSGGPAGQARPTGLGIGLAANG